MGDVTLWPSAWGAAPTSSHPVRTVTFRITDRQREQVKRILETDWRALDYERAGRVDDQWFVERQEAISVVLDGLRNPT